jgi:RNA polymerase sigma-70 factor (ECF subfamily)
VDEREAIRRLLDGDTAGLEFLVRQYQSQALRAAVLIVRDQALAQDLVQSAFVHAYERIHTFDVRRPFGPWFLKIVFNDALKAALRRSREIHDPTHAESAVEPGPGPERTWEQAETADEIWAALGQLTAAQRAAVVQRYYLGWTEAEMAADLDCPPSTIKSRLHAARERLRLLLRPATHDLETTL